MRQKRKSKEGRSFNQLTDSIEDGSSSSPSASSVMVSACRKRRRAINCEKEKCVWGYHKRGLTIRSLTEICQEALRLTIRAAERQNAAPLALEAVYSTYSDSKYRRSASAIARSRGSCTSKPEIVHPPLQHTCQSQKQI